MPPYFTPHCEGDAQHSIPQHCIFCGSQPQRARKIICFSILEFLRCRKDEICMFLEEVPVNTVQSDIPNPKTLFRKKICETNPDVSVEKLYTAQSELMWYHLNLNEEKWRSSLKAKGFSSPCPSNTEIKLNDLSPLVSSMWKLVLRLQLYIKS